MKYKQRGFFSILLFFLFSSISAIAQNDLIEKIISINSKDQPIKNLLSTISKNNNVLFSYSSDQIDVEKIISVQVKNKTIREVLDIAFANKVRYKSNATHIILLKKKAESYPDKIYLSGYVIDKTTGEKIAQASIYERLSLASAVTNQYGFYELKLPIDPSKVVLIVNKKDYYNERNLVNILAQQKVNLFLSPQTLIKVPSIFPNYSDTLEAITDYPLAAAIVSKKQIINFRNIQDTIYRPFQISLVPFIGTNQLVSSNVVNDLSINIFAGLSGGVRGVEIGGFANINRWDMKGFQSAGFVNFVGGKANGFQTAGFGNFVLENVNGFQNSGFFNINKGDFKGLQLTGFINANYGKTKGTQISGNVNTNYDQMKGVQIAGLGNINYKSITGTQIAGLGNINLGKKSCTQIAGSVNFAYGKTSGLQIASLVNINANEISGAQISGLVNVANKVNKGFQLGVVNYADSSNSIPIGLFSFVRKGGYRRLEVGINEQAFINASLKTGVRRFYTIFQSGIWSQQASKPIWSYGLGIGKSVFFKNNWNFDFQGTHAFVNNGNSLNTDNQLIKIHFIVEKKLSKSTSLAVGPVVNGFFEKKFQDNGKLISDFVPYDLKTYDLINNTVKTWIGFTASIRFFDVNGFGK